MKKKRMSAEERKEFKGGKYMGGPAEEKAEKKKKGKRMAMGGTADGDGVARLGAGATRPGMQNMRFDKGVNVPGRGIGQNEPPTPSPRPAVPLPTSPIAGGIAAKPPAPGRMPMPGTKVAPSGGGVMNRNLGLGLNAPRPVPTRTNAGLGLRGGGLAKKGVGQALAKGGLVKGAGCAKRGVKKPRYT